MEKKQAALEAKLERLLGQASTNGLARGYIIFSWNQTYVVLQVGLPYVVLWLSLHGSGSLFTLDGCTQHAICVLAL
jgi:hypothetical protein